MKFPVVVIAILISTPAFSAGRCHAQSPIHTVYVTGSKAHSVKWAMKHLRRFGGVTPTANTAQADAILDLEPVNSPTPVTTENNLPTFVVCRDSRSGISVSCHDNSGGYEKTSCQTSQDGRVACWSSYFNLASDENMANELSAAAETHAYLLSKDGKKLLWEYDESAHSWGTWNANLKRFVKGCQ